MIIYDEGIMAHIRSSFEAHAEIDASRVRIEVQDGFVSLSGLVHTEEEKQLMVGLVESLDGVKELTSFLEIDTVIDVFNTAV
jgi:osmotically-inducible protein OsmY